MKTQIIIGRGIYGISVLWFHFNLIFLTIFFFIFSFILKDYYLPIFQIISQNIWMSVGNLLETFPIAICAFTFASFNFHQILLKNKKKSFFFSFLLIYILSNYRIFKRVKGFSSAGFQNIFTSITLFSFFYLLPYENLNSNLLLIIKQITKFTQGIYCLHFLFQYYMKLKIEENGSFFGCIILYFISYLASFIGFIIFNKTKLKYLFI